MDKRGNQIIAGAAIAMGVVVTLEPFMPYQLLGQSDGPSKFPYIVFLGLWLVAVGVLMLLAINSATMHAVSLIVGYAPIAVFAALGARLHPVYSWLFALNVLIVIYCASGVLEGLRSVITGTDVRNLAEDD